MPRYHFAEGAVDLPPGWLDQSVHMLIRAPSTSAAEERPPSVVMNREPLVGTLSEQVSRSIVALSRTLPGFRVVDERAIVVGDLPGVSVELGWRKDRVPVSQKIVFVAYGDVVLTIALSAGKGPWTEAKRELDGIVASLRFRKPEALL